MKKFILLLLFTISASAQIKGVVRDSITKEPIAYVSILVENKKIGTTSALDGSFEINSKLETNDNLLFSIIGYEIKKVKSSVCSVVELVSKSIEIKQVNITSKSFKKTQKVVGKAQKSNHFFCFPSFPLMISKKFDYNTSYEKTPYLQSIKVITATNNDNVTFKLRLFKIDTLTLLPKETLVHEEMVVTVKKTGKHINEIDVSKYNLEFPKEGLVVSIENIISLDNTYTFKVENSKNEIRYYETYEPTILLNSNYESGFIYEDFQWKKIADIFKKNTLKNIGIEPAISLTLSN